jgi:hypothetical protein
MNPPPPVTRLRSDLHRVLWKAAAAGRVSTSPTAINDALKIGTPPDDILKLHPTAWAIVGGIKDHKRRASSARFVRDDGAWIHFALAVTDTAEILAYDFELVFDQVHEARAARFVRIDLNPIGHTNDLLRDRRCHLHPGHDDVQVPWYQQPPVEILDFLVNRLPLIKER